MASAAPVAGRWLYGPALDLLLGCGALYALLIIAFAVGGAGVRAELSGLWLPILVFVVSLPHYGATLVRVYEHREDRRRYAVFAVYTTLVLIAAFALGTRHVLFGSLLLTIYLTWSPWHYSGQNYGLAVMFLRRRGIDPSPATKRLLQASFVLSYAMVFLVFHSDRGGGFVLYNETAQAGAAITSISLGIPRPFVDAAFAVVGVGYLASLALCAGALLRRAPPRELLPAGMLVLTQALWFALPFGVAQLGLRTGLEPIDSYSAITDYVFWVAVAHGIQYLWVTSYYARGSRGWGGHLPYLVKTLAAGVAVWTVPAVLFSPDLLGTPSSLASVALLVASVVNLHHFILDGAIWKLRDGRIASVLLRARSASAPERTTAVGGGGSWLRRGVWAALGVWLALRLAAIAEFQWVAQPAIEQADSQRLRASATRLRWLGQDTPDLYFHLGSASGARGDLATARRDFERSLELQESGRAWIGLGFVAAEEGDGQRARRALERALELEPRDSKVWEGAADLRLALGDRPGARDALERALEISPGRSDLRAKLGALVASPAPAAGGEPPPRAQDPLR